MRSKREPERNRPCKGHWNRRRNADDITACTLHPWTKKTPACAISSLRACNRPVHKTNDVLCKILSQSPAHTHTYTLHTAARSLGVFLLTHTVSDLCSTRTGSIEELAVSSQVAAAVGASARTCTAASARTAPAMHQVGAPACC